MHDRVVITTGARLHFGFFAHRPRLAETDERMGLDSPTRQSPPPNYGGIGLMIDTPGTVVAVSRSDRDRVECSLESADEPQPDPHAEEDLNRPDTRAWRFLTLYRRRTPPDRKPPPCLIQIRRTIPPHSGLGSGSQLGMAIAQSLALLAGDERPDSCTLAQRVGRGKRSAIGIHGFTRGGFLVDAGKRTEDELGRLVARADVPDGWRFLLLAPPGPSGGGLSGQNEIEALARLPEMSLALTEKLCRLTLLEILPALGESDIERFGEGLFEFGCSVGDYFRPAHGDGGRYADPQIAPLVDWLRSEKIRGVAQTSWGPTVAAVCADTEQAEWLKARILADARREHWQARIAAPLNTGAAIQF